MKLSLLLAVLKKAGLTLMFMVELALMPAKYLGIKVGLMPTCNTNIPIGSLAKFTSIEKLKRVLGMYEARIETAELSPLMIFAERTLLHLFWQSAAESNKA